MIKIKNNFNPHAAWLKQRAIIGAYAGTASKKMERDAKRNASWTDRTGNARNSIQGDAGWVGNNCKIVLSGNVDYFVYLELTMGKKYAILKPTINRNAPEVFRNYQKLVK